MSLNDDEAVLAASLKVIDDVENIFKGLHQEATLIASNTQRIPNYILSFRVLPGKSHSAHPFDQKTMD